MTRPEEPLTRERAYTTVLADIDASEAELVEGVHRLIARYDRARGAGRALMARDYADALVALDHVRATRTRIVTLARLHGVVLTDT